MMGIATTPDREHVEAHCRGCGHWLATMPPGSPWVRLRCHNRRCRLYRQTQTIRLDDGAVLRVCAG